MHSGPGSPRIQEPSTARLTGSPSALECGFMDAKPRSLRILSTSTGTFLGVAEDDVVARIEKRVAQVTMIPKEHQEGFQILHYKGELVNDDGWVSTTVDEGGETVFPNADKKVSGDEWSECAQKGLAVKAKKGDAVMFYALRPDGFTDATSLHASCPTTGGNKWSATKWIHVSSLRPKAQAMKTGCDDTKDQCSEWAFFGECEKNPIFMADSCKRSCKLCDEVKAH
eukprot:gene8663-34114_t